MSTYLAGEVRLASMSLVLGCVLMVSYDGLRLFRFFIPHSRFWTGIEDFLYWVYAAVMTFILLFSENSGIIRAYVIAGVFCGMILYDKIISRNVFRLLKKLKRWGKMKRKTHSFLKKKAKNSRRTRMRDFRGDHRK